jgi:hypothetical protein
VMVVVAMMARIVAAAVTAEVVAARVKVAMPVTQAGKRHYELADEYRAADNSAQKKDRFHGSTSRR